MEYMEGSLISKGINKNSKETKTETERRRICDFARKRFVFNFNAKISWLIDIANL
jgi:hypothetical protein